MDMWGAVARVWAIEIREFQGEIDPEDGTIQLCLEENDAAAWLSDHILMCLS